MFITNTINSALKCASTTLRNKIIASPDDLIGVMLYNTTNNNINLIAPIDEPNVQMIKALESFKPLQETQERRANLTIPFNNSLNILSSKRYENYSKRIFLFTTEDDPHSSSIEDDRSSKLSLRDLNQLGVELELFPLKEDFDLGIYWADACQIMSSSYQNDHPFEDKLEILLQRVQKKEKKKRILGRLHFHLLPSHELNRITFSCNFYSLISSAGNTAPPLWITKDEMSKSLLPGGGGVERGDRNNCNEDINYSLDFGGKKVKFDEESWIEEMFHEERNMQLISIHQRSSIIGKLWGMGIGRHSFFLRPDDNDLLKSSVIFSSFRRAMLNEKMCALVHFKLRIKSPLRLGLLIPSEDCEECVGFHLIVIPFLEDIRTSLVIEDIGGDGGGDDEEKKYFSLLQKAFERLKLPDGFVIENYDNPSLLYHYQALEDVAMSNDGDGDGNNSKQTQVDSTIPNVKAMHRRAGEYFKEYNNFLNDDEPLSKRKNNK